MSSYEDSTTQEASASGSDAASAAPNAASHTTEISMIPDYVDVRDPVDLRSITAILRDEADKALAKPAVMKAVKPYLVAGNHAGTAQTAHGEIGRIVINSSPLLSGLRDRGELTHILMWRQVLHVLQKGGGYIFASGFFLTNSRDEAEADAQEAA